MYTSIKSKHFSQEMVKPQARFLINQHKSSNVVMNDRNVTTSDLVESRNLVLSITIPSLTFFFMYLNFQPLVKKGTRRRFSSCSIRPHDGAHTAGLKRVKGITRRGGHVGRSRGSGTSSQATDVMT